MKYVQLVAVMAALWFLGSGVEGILHHLDHGFEGAIMPAVVALGAFCAVAVLSVYLSKGTALPPFMTLALLTVASQEFFLPVLGDSKTVVLMFLAIVGAVLILLQGGLETPFHNFRKLFWKIASLAFVGLFVTAVLFSYGLVAIGGMLGVSITAVTAVLLGAILASTDPAAIVPVTRDLKWKDLTAKDTVVAGSALSDVTGALLTFTLLPLAVAGSMDSIWTGGYAHVLTGGTVWFIVQQVLIGTCTGLIGWLILHLFDKYTAGQKENHAVDMLVIVFVALVPAYMLALIFAGNGFLAAFVAGLIFHVKDHMRHTEHRYADFIDVFGKGAVFFALGMLVDVQALIDYAFIGVLAAIAFMFIMRPIAVLISIGPFLLFQGKNKIKSVSWQDMAFMMWVRETGAIPAVLLVVAAGMSIPGTEALVPVGMWVIILTLIVQPPLTPWLAKKLDLVD